MSPVAPLCHPTRLINFEGPYKTALRICANRDEGPRRRRDVTSPTPTRTLPPFPDWTATDKTEAPR